jgi:glucokinase
VTARFVGVDVGGTKSAAVLIDGAGATIARTWTEHTGEWQGRLVVTVVTSIATLLEQAGTDLADVDGIGVAVAGLVGRDRSTVFHSPIVRETHLDLGTALATRTGRPVTVANDANAALYAIARHDGTSGVSVLLTLGTGVGGAVLVGGRLLVGEHGFATELGHITVDHTDPRPCVCGSRGCVEQYASGRGLEELARLEPPSPAATLPPEAARVAPRLSARGIVAAAEHGDPWATALLERAGAMLGRAVAILCVTLDPTTVTISGSLGHAAGRWLLPAATREMRDRWTYPAERPLPTLTIDSIGPYAAAAGAALLAAEHGDKDGSNA